MQNDWFGTCSHHVITYTNRQSLDRSMSCDGEVTIVNADEGGQIKIVTIRPCSRISDWPLFTSSECKIYLRYHYQYSIFDQEG